MVRTVGKVCLIVIALFGLVSTASAGEHWGNWGYNWGPYLGLGYSQKYYSTGGCPGFVQGRPLNPLLAVPLQGSYGQTGARRLLLFPPVYGSPLYNNTPRICPYPDNMAKNPDCLGPHCGANFFIHPYAGRCGNGDCAPGQTRPAAQPLRPAPYIATTPSGRLQQASHDEPNLLQR